MKTAVSVPNDLFVEVEQLAQRSHRSRSEVYSAALREYVARHDPDHVTEALDRVVDQLGELPAEADFIDAAARGVLAATEW